MKHLKKKDLLSLARKLMRKVSDAISAKECYQTFFINK